MRSFSTLPPTLVAVVTATLSCAVHAEDAIGFTNGNGAVRGYDATRANNAPITSVDALSEPQPQPQRATLGSPAVLAIVVGCVAAVALAVALAFRFNSRQLEPSTPRDEDYDVDDGGASVVSTKAIGTQYQQSFDGPNTNKPTRPLEPHSPKMPPPPPHMATASHAQGQRDMKENQPVDVVVVAM